MTDEMIDHENKIERAARALLELVRRFERHEGSRSSSAQLTLEVELADGTPETWQITIKRAPQ